MEYNKDEACRAMEIAEKKLAAQEVVTAKKLLAKAQQLYPSLEGLPQMMAVLDVYIAAEKKVNGQTDWYGILQVDTVADEALIKKQYRKLALMLHPDKNKCAGAEGAFKLIGEAWGVLSDKIKRSVYDHKRSYAPPPANRIAQKNPRPNAAPVPPRPQTAHNGVFFKSATGAPPTFWTACPHCRMQYEYLRNFINHNLQCPNCSKPFMALETSFLHKNGQTNFAGATGMPRGTGVPYPPFSAPPPSFPHNAVPRTHNAHSASASASASTAASAPGPAPAPAPTPGPVPAPAGPEKAKNEVPASKRKEDDLKKTDSKKENNGRKKSASEKSNKRRKKRSEDSDSDEVIRASSISDEDDDDVVEVVEKGEENAANKSKSRKKVSDEEEEEEEEEEEDEAPENIDVPDSDFYKFDDDRAPDSIKEEQIWAVYDDDDGMPRFYARIQKVLKSEEFEVQMNWLEPLTKEKSVVDWLDAGFYQSNGDFKVARKMSSGTLNNFSHVVAWVKRPKGIIRIEPQKGDVWALYKEWSSGWNEDTPPDDRHSYEMVEISTDFDDGDGVGVIPLVKVDGFKSVFQKTQLSKLISKDERRRFSHQVPAKKLLGNEQADLPKDCWELDPAATSGGGDMPAA